MSMENKIIEIVVYCVLALITAVSGVLIGFIKKKMSENATLSKQITPYLSAILTFSKEAEQHANYSADEKLEYVISRMIKYAVDNHVKIKDTSTIVSDINTLIDFSNNVNVKKITIVEGAENGTR